MISMVKLCAFGVLSALAISSANATITNAAWTFPAATSPAPAQPMAANIAAYSTSDVLGWTAGGSHLNETFVSNPGKTTALEFSYSGNQSSSMNNTLLTLTSTISGLTNGTFLTGIQISYETKWSNTGTPITQTWAYSLNGGAFSNFMTNTVAGNSWQNLSYAFPTLQLQNGDILAFRDTFSGASGNGQALDFDNIQITSANITPVPEPSSVTLTGFGIAAFWMRRRSRVSGRA